MLQRITIFPLAEESYQSYDADKYFMADFILVTFELTTYIISRGSFILLRDFLHLFVLVHA